MDEFRMVLDGQPTPWFLQQNSRKANFLPCLSSTITRWCKTRPLSKKGNQIQFVWWAIFEAVSADVLRNFWLPLTIGRHKMAAAQEHAKLAHCTQEVLKRCTSLPGLESGSFIFVHWNLGVLLWTPFCHLSRMPQVVIGTGPWSF